MESEKLLKYRSERFEELYQLHHKKLYLFAFRQAREHMLAEDAVHHAFTHLWNGWITATCTEDADNALPILFNALKQYIIQSHRKAALADKHLPLWNDYIKAHKQLDNHTQQQELMQAIRSLPARRQEVLMLNKFHGLSYKQISVKLNLSLHTVNAHMQQAFRSLRKILHLFF